MAVIRAAANGNWSTAATWIGGVVPGPGDTVHADNRAVIIDTPTITVESLRTTAAAGGTAGGSFTMPSAGGTVNGNILAGSSICLLLPAMASGTSIFTINGNVTAGTGANAHGISSSQASTIGLLAITGIVTGASVLTGAGVSVSSPNLDVTITGNINGGATGPGLSIAGGNLGTILTTGNVQSGSAATAQGIGFGGGGTLTHTGNATGSALAASAGIGQTGNGTVVLNGNAFGGIFTNSSNPGIMLSGNGTTIVNGDVYGATGTAGSAGAVNSGTGTMTINGSAYSGQVTDGARNSGSGNLYVKRAVGNASGPGPGVGISSVAGVNTSSIGGFTYIKEMEFGINGATPVIGAIRFTSDLSNIVQVRTELLGTKNLTDPANTAGLIPAEADVRLGTTYAAGNKHGTLQVPPVGAVAAGTPVDHSVGTAVLTQALVQAATAAIKASTDRIPANPAAVGSAMALTPAERESTAVRVESHLLDEGDSQPFINAMVAAIGNSNVELTAFVAAIRADIERNGGPVKLIEAKTANIPNSPAAVGSAMTLTPGERANIASPQNVTDARNAVIAALPPAPDNASIQAIKGAGFNTLTDSLAAIRAHGDEAWTGGGGSGDAPTAEEIWSYPERTITGGGNGEGNGMPPDLIEKLRDAPQILFVKLYEPTDAVIEPIPGPPPAASECRVTAYLITPRRKPAAGAVITFKLATNEAIRSGGNIIYSREVRATANPNGRILVYLDRNDLLMPTGSVWHVNCPEAGIVDFPLTLDGPDKDLAGTIIPTL